MMREMHFTEMHTDHNNTWQRTNTFCLVGKSHINHQDVIVLIIFTRVVLLVSIFTNKTTVTTSLHLTLLSANACWNCWTLGILHSSSDFGKFLYFKTKAFIISFLTSPPVHHALLNVVIAGMINISHQYQRGTTQWIYQWKHVLLQSYNFEV